MPKRTALKKWRYSEANELKLIAVLAFPDEVAWPFSTTITDACLAVITRYRDAAGKGK